MNFNWKRVTFITLFFLGAAFSNEMFVRYKTTKTVIVEDIYIEETEVLRRIKRKPAAASSHHKDPLSSQIEFKKNESSTAQSQDQENNFIDDPSNETGSVNRNNRPLDNKRVFRSGRQFNNASKSKFTSDGNSKNSRNNNNKNNNNNSNSNFSEGSTQVIGAGPLQVVPTSIPSPVNESPPTSNESNRSPVINNISLDQGKLILKGNNLDLITEVEINGHAISTHLTKVSGTSTEYVAMAFSGVALAMGKIYDLIISDAHGQSTFPIDIELEDGSIAAEKLAPLTLAEDGYVLKWDNTLGRWVPSPDNDSGGGGGGGSGTVTSVTQGAGLVGEGTSFTTTGTIAVNVGNDPDQLPQFNSDRELVFDNDNLLVFKNDSGDDEYAFRMLVDVLQLRNVINGTTIFEASGNSFLIGGQTVCLADGTNCPTFSSSASATSSFTVQYDTSNKSVVSVDSTGFTTVAATGAGAGFNFAGGNVGIGVVSPDTILSLKTDDNKFLKFDRTGDVNVDDVFESGVSYSAGGGADDFMYFGKSGTRDLVITDDGNVGIGTISPIDKLQVETDSTTVLGINTTGTTNTSRAILAFDRAGAQQWDIGVNTNNGGTNKLFFRRVPGANYAMTLDEDGKLGIGTTSPSSLLHLSGTTPTLTIDDGSYSHVIKNSQAEGLAGADLRIGLDESQRRLIIADDGDIDTDFNLTASLNPELVIMSGTASSKLQLSALGITGANGRGSIFIGEGGFTFNRNNSDLPSGNLFEFKSNGGVELTSNSTDQAWVSILPKINQSDTAGYTGLLVNVTETATGSGEKKLIDLQLAGTTVFSVSSDGAVYSATSNSGTSANYTSAGGSQLTVGYDDSNKTVMNVDSIGFTTFSANGVGAGYNFSGGNVGIGAAIPGEALDVVGNIRGHSFKSNGSLIDWPLADSTSVWMFRTGSTGTAYPFQGEGNLVLEARQTGSANGSGDIVFATGSTPSPKMVVRSNGNVGIGTSDPGVKLDVNGTVRSTRLDVDNIRVDGNTISSTDVNGAITITPTNSDIDLPGNDITILNKGGGRNANPGNVLISTANSSNYKSGDIIIETGSSSANDGGDIFLTAGDSTYGGGSARDGGDIYLEAGSAISATNNNKFAGSIILRPGYNSGDLQRRGNLDFEYFDGLTYTKTFRYDGFTGRVGIGTTLPETPLHVYKQGSGVALKVESDGHPTIQLGRTGVPNLLIQSLGGSNFSKFFDGTYDFMSFRHDSGRVGIGTSIPSSIFHIKNSNPVITLEDSDDAGSTFIFEDTPTKGDIKKTSTTSAIIKINPIPAPLETAGIQFFRNTNTTGEKAVFFLRGDDTATIDAKIGVDGLSSYFLSGNVGVGSNNPGYKLQVGEAGDGTEARANAWNLLSDERLKKDFQPIPNALDKILAINGYFYHWNRGPDKDRKIGVKAQEVEKVFPEVISEGKDGYKSVSYDHLIAPLIVAIKELYGKVIALFDRVEKGEERITKIESQIKSSKRSPASQTELDKIKAENKAMKEYLCKKDPEAPFCVKIVK